MRESNVERWIHPATILVATDLSDLDHLMPFAVEQAARTGARLILFHAVPSSAAFMADAAGMPYFDTAGALDIAEQALAPWREYASQHGIQCDPVVREGNPTQQIAAAVRQFQADRLLLGTRSRSKIGKLFLGSVAEQVLRSVYLPVITVGPEAHLPVANSGNKTVLYATTLREASRPSAALACRIAAVNQAALVLVHVASSREVARPKSQATAVDSPVAQNLRVLAEQAAEGCCSPIEPVVAHGNPAIEILALAAERHANLIVLGSTQQSVFENLTRGRTIYRILAHARCPVLTLRELQRPAAQSHAASAAVLH